MARARMPGAGTADACEAHHQYIEVCDRHEAVETSKTNVRLGFLMRSSSEIFRGSVVFYYLVKIHEKIIRAEVDGRKGMRRRDRLAQA